MGATIWSAGGINPGPANIIEIREEIVATAGQTVFNLTLGTAYVPGTNNLEVFRNGQLLYSGDYTETDTDTITMAAPGMSVGDKILFVIKDNIGITAVVDQQLRTDLANASDPAKGAGMVGNIPTGTIASDTVQGAIDEIVSDLVASSGSSLVGFLQAGTGAVARTVQAKERDVVSVKDFGAVGDGVTDDTTAIQAGIATTTANNASLLFPAGTYLCTNLTLPHNTAYDSNPVPWDQNMPRLVGQLGATIKKKTSADNTYLIAAARWVSNVTSVSSPVDIENIVFDGAGIAQDVFVDVHWGSRVVNCTFQNATRHGHNMAVTTKNGTAITNTRAIGYYARNKWILNANMGLNVPYDATAFITDYWLVDNLAYDNTVGNMNLAQCAGWKIRGNHCYNFGTAPAGGSTWSCFIGNGLDAQIGGNIWEGYAAQTYGLQIDGLSAPVTVEGEKFLGGLGCNASFNSANCKLIRVRNSVFTGSNSALRQGYSDATCELVSEGNTFDATSAYTFISNGSNVGVLRAKNDRIGTDQWVYTGRQKYGNYCVEIQAGVNYPAFGDTLTVLADGTQRFTAVLGADQSIYMPASPKRGMRYRVIRTASSTGAFSLKVQSNGGGAWFATVGGPSLFVDVEYDGANWIPTAPNAAAGL